MASESRRSRASIDRECDRVRVASVGAGGARWSCGHAASAGVFAQLWGGYAVSCLRYRRLGPERTHDPPPVTQLPLHRSMGVQDSRPAMVDGNRRVPPGNLNPTACTTAALNGSARTPYKLVIVTVGSFADGRDGSA